ncbi:MAG: NADH-quinone oxidoreductase subunit A [Planctomycetota bacterium]
MYFEYTNILIFFLVGIGFVGVNMVVGSLVRPKKPNPEKMSAYECGEDPIGPNRVQFDIRFYTVALIFIIFDVEIAFLFPWAAVFQEFKAAGQGGLVFFEVVVFVAILFLGLIYLWAKGDLDWVKSTEAQRRAALAHRREQEAKVATAETQKAETDLELQGAAEAGHAH